MRRRVFTWIGLAAFLASALLYASMLLQPDSEERDPGGAPGDFPLDHAPAATLHRPLSAPRAAGEEAAPSVLAPSAEATLADEYESRADEEASGDPTGDLSIYREIPMSQVPHVVVRGWGISRRSNRQGVVGAFVIVDPGIAEEDLEKLARDIREYHRKEYAVSVRILDNERAATYDRHSDGGALAQRHLVASVTRNDELDVDEIRIGERILEP